MLACSTDSTGEGYCFCAECWRTGDCGGGRLHLRGPPACAPLRAQSRPAIRDVQRALWRHACRPHRWVLAAHQPANERAACRWLRSSSMVLTPLCPVSLQACATKVLVLEHACGLVCQGPVCDGIGDLVHEPGSGLSAEEAVVACARRSCHRVSHCSGEPLKRRA